MYVSSIKFNTGLNIQKNKRKMDILKWIQKMSIESPRILNNTTAKQLAKLYCQQTTGVNVQTVQMMMSAMVKSKIIEKHPRSGQRSDIRINYLYPLLPRDFLQNAPQDAKDHIKKVMEIVEEKKEEGKEPEMTVDGAVVTKEEKEEEPKEEQPEVVEEPEQVETSVPVTVKKDGQNISITINLNLNLGGK